MKGPLAGLMQQAQRMQEDMKRAQEEIANMEVTGAVRRRHRQRRHERTP